MIREIVQSASRSRIRWPRGNGTRHERGPKPVAAGIRVAPGVRDVWTRFLMARLMWILLAAVFVTASAGGYLVTQKPVYKSQATVAIYPAAGATSAVQPFVMGTEKGVVSSGAVLSLASQSLLIPVSKLQSGLSITIPVDSDLLVIAYTDRNPQVAQSAAEAIAQAYVAYRTTALGPTAPKTGSSSTASLQVAVVTDATLPTSPDTPNPLLIMGVALILGLALGAGLALVLDWLDDRLRGAADLQAQASAGVLAQIPAFDRGKHRMAGGLVIVEHPQSPVAGAFVDLRTRVQQAASFRRAKTLLVTSPAGEDKSTVAANLAASFALSGRRVVLVCADLRDGRADLHFELECELGITSVVSGEAALADALCTTKVPGLEVLAGGPHSPDPSSVLQSGAFKDLLQILRAGADMVVIEAPSVLASADTAAMVEEADMVLLVADARISTRADVRAAVAELRSVRSRLIGCVLDNVGRAVTLAEPPASRTHATESPEVMFEPAMQEDIAIAAPIEEAHIDIDESDEVPDFVVVEAAALEPAVAAIPATNGVAHTSVRTKRRRH